MAALLLDIGRFYLWIGAAVAAVFVSWGMDRVEANARDAFAFRPLVVPGVILIWPLVLLRWRVLERGETASRRYRPPRRAQDILALVLAIAIPIIVTTALVMRQDGPHERPAVLIEAPEANR